MESIMPNQKFHRTGPQNKFTSLSLKGYKNLEFKKYMEASHITKELAENLLQIEEKVGLSDVHSSHLQLSSH